MFRSSFYVSFFSLRFWFSYWLFISGLLIFMFRFLFFFPFFVLHILFSFFFCSSSFPVCLFSFSVSHSSNYPFFVVVVLPYTFPLLTNGPLSYLTVEKSPLSAFVQVDLGFLQPGTQGKSLSLQRGSQQTPLKRLRNARKISCSTSWRFSKNSRVEYDVTVPWKSFWTRK